MKLDKLWFVASGLFAAVGMLLTGFVSQALAQWNIGSARTMDRGQIAHTIHNPGNTGKWDNNKKLGQTGFSYPAGRHTKVYSGGMCRDGWNAKNSTGGEGIWILSNTGGTPHVTAAGSRVTTTDIVMLEHNPSTYPEAYLGMVHDEDWPLARRRGPTSTAQVNATRGLSLAWLNTTWWPARGGLASATEPVGPKMPVIIWNYRLNEHNSGESFTDRIAKGEFEQMTAPAWAEALSEDDFPEEIGITKAKSSATDLQWTRKWYQFGHSDYDDFMINDNVVENTGSATQEGVYITFQNRFWSQNAGGWRGWNGIWNKPNDWSRDDHARSTMASNYLTGVSRDAFIAGQGKPAGTQEGKDLADAGHAFLYGHDGESTHITNLVPDVGDPYRYEFAHSRMKREQAWIQEGYLNHAKYFGIGVVDALPPFNTYGGLDPEIYKAPEDNPATPHDESMQQPASVTIYRFTSHSDYSHPSPMNTSDGDIYDAMTLAGYPDEPEEAYSYTHFMTFGPWTLAPGEKAKVVVAYVGGTGASDPKFENYKTFANPNILGWKNLWAGPGKGYVKFSDRQKDIPLGEDAMFRHFKRAIQVYDWGYDLPNQPANMRVSWKSNLQGQTQISWSSFGEDGQDPDYEGDEAKDLRGYRIYRSDKFSNEGPYQFVAEFSFADAQAGDLPAGITYLPNTTFRSNQSGAYPEGIALYANRYVDAESPDKGAEIPGMYTYDDPGTKAGFANWYAVRYYDSGHSDWKGTGNAVPVLESAPGMAAGGIIGYRGGVVPVVPGDAMFDNLEAQVRVVPNPYRQDTDLHSYNRQQDVRFINLPGRCRIDLYDVAGTRIWTMFNDNPLKGELTWIQLTEGRPSNFGEAVFPGIYFWKVTSLMPGAIGKTQTGTFVMIK